MKKNVMVIVATVLMMAATQPVQALSGACERLTSTATGTWSQAYWYAACVGNSLSQAWELFLSHF